MPRLFFSYSHVDEGLRDQLEKQLSLLKRQGVIETWHDRRIGAGTDFEHAINAELESCEIILLLVSPDFLASDYCYDIEMTRAMQRNETGEAIVIPVILRPCLWTDAPFGRLNATPPDGRPVTQWPDRDQAFMGVARSIKDVAARFTRADPGSPAVSVPASVPAASPTAISPQARSSNLRVTKTFSERDKDRFKQEAFDYMASYFANSLEELARRNPGIEGDFRKIDANRFIAVVYRNGKAVARCTIFIGGGFFGNGIAYSATETTESNSCNETLRVEADDQMLYLTSSGMAHMGGRGEREPKLSQEGAAEFYWSMLVEPLQRSGF